LVEKNGGIVHESMKKDTDYLVLADVNSTSSKAVKARKQGTTLMSEDDFVKMCGGV
jgi:DNA ligase (NAD+)